MLLNRQVLSRFFLSLLLAPLLRAEPQTNQTPAVPKDVLGVTAVGDSPMAVAIHPIANLAFVANRGSRDITVLNLATRQVTGKYTVGGLPEGIAVNPRTNRVVVASLDGSVTIIDHTAGAIVATVPAGKAPSRVAIDEIRNTALVTNFNGANMVIIDLTSNRVVKTIALKTGPLGIAVLGVKPIAVVACQYDMNLLTVNLEKGEVDSELLVGRYLSEVAAIGSAGPVVVGNPSSNGILSIFDPMTNRMAATLPVGAGPLSVAVYPRRNVALVAEYSGGTVTIVDLTTGTVVNSIKVGQGPCGIAVHPESGIAVVVDRVDGNATFLDVESVLRLK
jgi:serine/threonine protein kinase, bacterial